MRFLITIMAFLTPASLFAQIPAIQPGIPQELARWRAAHYSDIRYELDLKIEKMSPVLKGTIEIEVTVSGSNGKNTVPIILDWRKVSGHERLSKISDVLLNGRAAMFEELNEHLVFRKGIREGKNAIKIAFQSPILTSGGAVTRYIDKEDGSEYIYSLFVPADASSTFPVFDQPDLKARFDLSLKTPDQWKVVANGKGTGDLEGKQSQGNTRFATTKPISTYVFAFAAGPFREIGERGVDSNGRERAERGPPIRFFVRRSQAEKFKLHAKEFFRLNREAITYFEEYFEYKFPFPKYDVILIPEFPFGGMEHAGATFLRENSVIFPSEPTANNYISRATVIFHEAAHQWFGDTVTMKWFDDLWLKEGFATFMAYKAMEKVLPEYDSRKVFYQRVKPGAYRTDVTKGTTPIYQEIPNLNSAKSAYGNIVYQKAPSFLRQAEFFLGEDAFRTAVRSFLKEHEYGNAGWSDLVGAFEKASGRDLCIWADGWVKRRGLPIIRLEKNDLRVYRKLGRPHNIAKVYSLAQDDAQGEGGNWIQRTSVLLRSRNGVDETKTVAVEIGGKRSKTGFARYWTYLDSNPDLKPDEPVFVFPNYRDHGYGVFLLDRQSREYVLKNIRKEKNGFLRAMMWGSLWDSVRFAELAPSSFIHLAIRNIDVEQDVTTISSILGRVNTAFTYYLSADQKAAVGPKLEELLISRMLSAKTLEQRITYFRALLRAASGKKARAELKSLLRTGKETAAIPIRSKDRFDIVTRLIILGDSEAPNLLAGLEKTEKGDAALRYAYAAKAGFASKGNKEKFWKDFVSNKKIPERWTEAAFRVWNAPAHSELTFPYLKKALAELPALKRDRKIFFVNGWLSSFIGGQKRKEALAIVMRFLADNKGMDEDLRRKILENVDGLERAVKIRAKFGT